MLGKVSDARITLTKLEEAEDIIWKIYNEKQYSTQDKVNVESLPAILGYCEISDSEISLCKEILKEMLRNPEDFKVREINTLLKYVHICEGFLESFIEDYDHSELVGTFISEEKYDRYLAMFKKDIYGTQVPEIKEKIRSIIYESPGHYIYEIFKHLSRKNGMSYQTVLRYVNKLEDEGEVLTIGGPQGVERYCFPEPNRIEDRSKYYGRYFAVKGEVEEMVTDHFKTKGTFSELYDFYIVNNQTSPRMILAVDWGVNLPIEPSVMIRTFGFIFPFEKFTQQEGYYPETDFDKLDFLRCLRIVKEEEKEIIWEHSKGIPRSENLA